VIRPMYLNMSYIDDLSCTIAVSYLCDKSGDPFCLPEVFVLLLIGWS